MHAGVCGRVVLEVRCRARGWACKRAPVGAKTTEVREPAVAKLGLGLEARTDATVLADAVVGVRARVVRDDDVGVLAKAAVATMGRKLANRRQKASLRERQRCGLRDA